MEDEILVLVDKIIEEHQLVFSRFKNLEGMLSDAEAISGIDEAKEAFMPGRLDREQGLPKLLESLEIIEQGIEAHFNREETALLAAFEKHGDKNLVFALEALLVQHEDLRSRLTDSKRHVTELIGGGLARQQWEASAHDMRAHITHTQQLFHGHAAGEQPLLMEIRKRLVEGTKKD